MKIVNLCINEFFIVSLVIFKVKRKVILPGILHENRVREGSGWLEQFASVSYGKKREKGREKNTLPGSVAKRKGRELAERVTGKSITSWSVIKSSFHRRRCGSDYGTLIAELVQSQRFLKIVDRRRSIDV